MLRHPNYQYERRKSSEIQRRGKNKDKKTGKGDSNPGAVPTIGTAEDSDDVHLGGDATAGQETGVIDDNLASDFNVRPDPPVNDLSLQDPVGSVQAAEVSGNDLAYTPSANLGFSVNDVSPQEPSVFGQEPSGFGQEPSGFGQGQFGVRQDPFDYRQGLFGFGQEQGFTGSFGGVTLLEYQSTYPLSPFGDKL